jgi:hypothetical protein
MSEPRTVTVHGAIATHLFRRHLNSSGVTWEQVPQPPPEREFFKGYSTGVFRVEATEAQWAELNRYVQEVTA